MNIKSALQTQKEKIRPDPGLLKELKIKLDEFLYKFGAGGCPLSVVYNIYFRDAIFS
mgnify:CR=1 FL=1